MIDCAGRPGGVHLGCPASFSASQDRGRTPVTLDNRASEDLLGVGKKDMPSIAFHYTNLVEAIRITATCVVGLAHEILNSLQSRLRISSLIFCWLSVMQFPWQHIQVGEPSVTMGWKTCDKKVLTFWFPWYSVA